MASNSFTVLYDSCTLFPAILRDLLVRLATLGLFKGRWTEEIHDEWIRAVIEERGIDQSQLRRTADLMNKAVLDCLITDYELVTVNFDLPDEGDRHVMQAAVKGRVDVIVTFNKKHFPSDPLGKLGIQVQHPDEFVSFLLGLAPQQVCQTAGKMRAGYRKPPLDRDEFFRRLERTGMALTVQRMKDFLDLI